MRCERLLKLAKSWYLSVKDETMAPARMVQFIENHVASCEVCQEDPDIQDEIKKITEIVLPESKIPKTVRMQQEKEEQEESDDEEEDEKNTDQDEEEEEEYIDDDDLDEEEYDDLEED